MRGAWERIPLQRQIAPKQNTLPVSLLTRAPCTQHPAPEESNSRCVCVFPRRQGRTQHPTCANFTVPSVPSTQHVSTLLYPGQSVSNMCQIHFAQHPAPEDSNSVFLFAALTTTLAPTLFASTSEQGKLVMIWRRAFIRAPGGRSSRGRGLPFC